MSTVSVAFESKVPHTTPWLNVRYPVDAPPAELFQALAAIEWREDGLRQAPPIDGELEIFLNGPKGSALFGGWTEQEKANLMPIVRGVLRELGFPNVPWNRLTLEDLL